MQQLVPQNVIMQEANFTCQQCIVIFEENSKSQNQSGVKYSLKGTQIVSFLCNLDIFFLKRGLVLTYFSHFQSPGKRHKNFSIYIHVFRSPCLVIFEFTILQKLRIHHVWFRFNLVCLLLIIRIPSRAHYFGAKMRKNKKY